MIETTAVAKHFAAIFSSAFKYDHNGVAHWPALALNYTTRNIYSVSTRATWMFGTTQKNQ
jgi:hypothetical protein